MDGKVSLLIDTNVWLDYFLASRPGHESAFKFFFALSDKEANLFYAATTAKDIFFIAGSIMKGDWKKEHGCLTEANSSAINVMCWGITEAMEEMATPVGVDASDFWLARKYRSLHKDLEDNLVLAAAQRAKVDVLVTNDVNLIKHAPVPAMTPDDAIAYLYMG